MGQPGIPEQRILDEENAKAVLDEAQPGEPRGSETAAGDPSQSSAHLWSAQKGEDGTLDARGKKTRDRGL